MMLLKDTLRRPLVTEKSTNLRRGATAEGSDRTYAFEVALEASKPQIKRAIEQYYGVQVDRVRTAVVRGKTKRFGRYLGKRRNWKKAFVTLASGHTLNLFE